MRRGGAPSVILSLPIGHSSTHLHAAPITWVGMGVTCVAQVSLSEDRVPSGSRKVDHSLGGPWSHLRPRSWQVYPNILMSLLPQSSCVLACVPHRERRGHDPSIPQPEMPPPAIPVGPPDRSLP